MGEGAILVLIFAFFTIIIDSTTLPSYTENALQLRSILQVLLSV